MTYESKSDWAKARRDDWERSKPAPQKLTLALGKKGTKLYSVLVHRNDRDQKTAKAKTWEVSSLRKKRKARHIGIIKTVRDVRLFLIDTEFRDEANLQLSCSGDEGKEVIEEGYYTTPQKALSYALKKVEHDIKWSKNRPAREPEERFLDEMFSTAKFESDRDAILRLSKRLEKKPR
jgi:hypothetical protein